MNKEMSHHMNAEMKHHALDDDALETVSGGGVTVKQPQLFQLDDSVRILYSGISKSSTGRITDCDYDEKLGEWTYQVELGHYIGNKWVRSGASSDKYYPQSRLERYIDDETVGTGVGRGST